MPPSPLIIFLHIPKAGGTTLLRVLERIYPAHAAFINPLLSAHEGRPEFEELDRLTENERHALRLVAGHMYFGVHRLFERPCRYFSILRDPVRRVVSDYRYIQRAAYHPFHDAVTKKGMTLGDYMESGLAEMADNGQVRLLSGRKGIAYGGVSAEDLELAKRNLEEHFAVVGTLERYDETLLRLRRALDWPMPYYVRERVARGKPPDLDDASRKAVDRHNLLDRELYNWVREREETWLAAQGEDFAGELEALRRGSRRRERWERLVAGPVRRVLDRARGWKQTILHRP